MKHERSRNIWSGISFSHTHPHSSTVDVSLAVTSFLACQPHSTMTHHPHHRGFLIFGLTSVSHPSSILSGSWILHLLLLHGLFYSLPWFFRGGDLREKAVSRRGLTCSQSNLCLMAQRKYVDDIAGDLAYSAERVWWSSAYSVDRVSKEGGDVGDRWELFHWVTVDHVTQQALQVSYPSPLVAMRNGGRVFKERPCRGGMIHFLLSMKMRLLASFHHRTAEVPDSVTAFRRDDKFRELLQTTVGHRRRKWSCRQEEKKIKVLGILSLIVTTITKNLLCNFCPPLLAKRVTTHILVMSYGHHCFDVRFLF